MYNRKDDFMTFIQFVSMAFNSKLSQPIQSSSPRVSGMMASESMKNLVGSPDCRNRLSAMHSSEMHSVAMKSSRCWAQFFWTPLAVPGLGGPSFMPKKDWYVCENKRYQNEVDMRINH